MRNPTYALLVTVALGVLGLGAAALAQAEKPTPSPPATRGAQAPAPDAASAPRHALAVLRPTSDHKASGTVRFEETQQGVRVTASLTGLPGGLHAYHVHVYGDCSAADATSAGPHFRFGPSDTGITGNLGELKPSGGRASAEQLVKGATLRGERSIVGRAVVVHAKGNDPSRPPDGGAGARIACGVIGIDQAAP